MSFRTETVHREFSPKEAAEVSGVSPDLQRDWRRRGVLPGRVGGKWTSFTLYDVIQLTVMRAFSQSGLSLELAETFSGLAILPVLATFYRWDDTAIFTGDELSEDDQKYVRANGVRGASEDQQFSFVALPPSNGEVSAARLEHLARGEQMMSEIGSFHGIVIDHIGLAHHIAQTAKLPLAWFRITILPEESEAK
jgi:hypothetical protein